MQRTPADGAAAERPGTSPAEWARTLAEGSVAATLHLPRPPHEDGSSCAAASRTEPFAVRHLAGSGGDVLLLVADGGPLAERLDDLLRNAPDGRDVPAVLDVLDVPPGLSGLPRARLCATGWIQVLPPGEQRRLAAALPRPVPALLDVGSGKRLVRLDLGEVRVTTRTGVHLVPDDDYVTARPDPLYPDEHDVVSHLEAHHADHLVGWALRELPLEQARQVREVSVAGIDRYGLDVLCTLERATVQVRAPFATPLAGEHELPAALCAALDCPCGGAGRGDAPHDHVPQDGPARG
ncbi:DUF2470 domain-containing protein [Kineococcus glutinatus]|uniref:DUF2470 domain-containing protein n=1 Tax=Kineococcus glutinatus TaxID=1070872 RepID=A0ABP9I3J3_9ACTN